MVSTEGGSSDGLSQALSCMVGMPNHEELRILTARQHGVVSRRQLADLGFSRQAVAHAVATGKLERLTPRVLRLCGSAPTREQRASAACLDVPGGALALHTAAGLWRVPGFAVEPFHVVTDRAPHRGGSRLALAHSTTTWSAEDVVLLDGLPITTPLRTLRDLAGRIPNDRLSSTCDRLLQTRLLHLAPLHALGAALPEFGRSAKTRALRELVTARPPGYRPPESNLERRFESILDRAGDEAFDRQVDLGDGTGWIGRVDFLDRARRVVVEIQSDLFHAGLVDRARDAERVRRLRAAGWIVLELTEHEVWHRADLVLARVRSARAEARSRMAHTVTPRVTN